MDFCRKQVKSDCEELLCLFQKTDSVRFEIFAKIWREMKFPEIFYGTKTYEKRAFSRLILDEACCFFLPPFSFQIRVGGLYLLYSLYGCQTASPPEQIRLALKDWEYLKKFEKDAVNAQHYDVVYILHQLTYRKAFHFTAMPTMLVFKKKRSVERTTLCEEFMERPSGPQELVSVELMDELSNIHKLYEKMKASIFSEKTDSSINLIRKDFVPQLRSSVVDFYKWQRRNVRLPDGSEEEDSGEGTSSQAESSRRAELLASIKSKAFGQAAEATKSRRHRQVEVELKTNEAGPSHASGSNRTTKPSLKARTENMQIKGEAWKDVNEITKISQLTSVDFGGAPEEKPKILKKFKWS